jgi:hypothetical protein
MAGALWVLLQVAVHHSLGRQQAQAHSVFSSSSWVDLVL